MTTVQQFCCRSLIRCSLSAFGRETIWLYSYSQRKTENLLNFKTHQFPENQHVCSLSKFQTFYCVLLNELPLGEQSSPSIVNIFELVAVALFVSACYTSCEDLLSVTMCFFSTSVTMELIRKLVSSIFLWSQFPRDISSSQLHPVPLTAWLSSSTHSEDFQHITTTTMIISSPSFSRS